MHTRVCILNVAELDPPLVTFSTVSSSPPPRARGEARPPFLVSRWLESNQPAADMRRLDPSLSSYEKSSSQMRDVLDISTGRWISLRQYRDAFADRDRETSSFVTR